MNLILSNYPFANGFDFAMDLMSLKAFASKNHFALAKMLLSPFVKRLMLWTDSAFAMASMLVKNS